MIILAPGCTHFDKIDPRTGRKMNLCYRTYRLRAKCVFEMFSAFLTTKGGEQVRPALLVRSGKRNTKLDVTVGVSEACCGTVDIRVLCEQSHAYQRVSKTCRSLTQQDDDFKSSITL